MRIGKPAHCNSHGFKDCRCRCDVCVLLALLCFEAHHASPVHPVEGSAVAQKLVKTTFGRAVGSLECLDHSNDGLFVMVPFRHN